MEKVAVVVLADVESHGDLGRIVNALELAKECKEAGDDLRIVFDGAGTLWAAQLANPGHRLHRTFAQVEDHIAGVCYFCAVAFGVKEQVEASGMPLLDTYEGHPSLRSLVAEGYKVITF